MNQTELDTIKSAILDVGDLLREVQLENQKILQQISEEMHSHTLQLKILLMDSIRLKQERFLDTYWKQIQSEVEEFSPSTEEEDQ